MNFRKHSDKDFNVESLPHNRKEVFFDTVKLRFGLYIILGLILFLFSMPLLATKIYGEILYTSNFNKYADDIDKAILAGNIIKMYISIFEIPGFLILSIGLAGVLKVIRQLIWQEGIFLKEDFFTGIKQNAKVYLISAFLFSLINVFIRLTLTLNISFPFILYIPVGVMILFVLPVLFYIFTSSQIYNNKYGTFLKNSVYFYIKTIWQSLLFSLVIVALLLIDLISIIILKYVIIFLIIVFVVPFLLSIKFLFDCSIYDKYINQYDYPELVDKGIERI